MKIEINGINGIYKASLELDKLTVLGGINSTKKTTILALLDEVLEFYNTSEIEMMNNFINNSSSILSLVDIFGDEFTVPMFSKYVFAEEIIFDTMQKMTSINDMIDLYNNIIIELKKIKDSTSNELIERIFSPKDFETITQEMVENWFVLNFLRKFKFDEGNGYISLYENTNDENPIIEISSINGEKAVLVASSTLKKAKNYKRDTIRYIDDFSSRQQYYFPSEFVVDDSILNKMENISFQLESDENDNIVIREKDNLFPINKAASGMVVFAHLEQLYKTNALIEGSWLILDEPDVHLHPEWQLTLAKMLKYIVNELKVNIVISTHNILTVENLLIEENCNVYLMKNSQKGTEAIKCQSDLNTNELLEELNEAFYARYM